MAVKNKGILDDLFKTKYIGFLDIEFQIIQSSVQEPHILELGIIIFEKNNNIPVLIEHVNFPLLSNSNIRLLNSKYTTVSDKNEILIKKLEDSVFHIDINSFESIKIHSDLIKFIPNKKIK